MRIGVPRERKPGERRVALTPGAVGEVVGGGHRVVVKTGAGERSYFADHEYEGADAQLVGENAARQCDLIVKVKEPVGDEHGRLGPEQTLSTFLHLAAS